MATVKERITERFRTREVPIPARPCPNCGDWVETQFCAECGQRNLDRLVSLRRLLKDVIEDQLFVNTTVPRTLSTLIGGPGKLTTEYAAGRIVRYTSPFRLYLVCSIVFFLLLSFSQSRTDAVGDPEAARGDAQAALAEAQAALAEARAAAGGVALPALAEAQAALDEARAAAADTALQVVPADTVPQAAGQEAEAEEPPVQEEERQILLGDFIGDLEINSPYPSLNRRLEATRARVSRMTPEEFGRAFLDAFNRQVPRTMFVLLPIYALLLKLLYIRRGRLYVEHFIFSLHVHTFTFLAFTLMLFVRRDLITFALGTWVAVYVFLAMRRVYGQSKLKTGIKFLMLGGTYGFLILFALVATALVAAVSL